MAITKADLTVGWSDTNATSYATASITPTGDRLILAAVFSSKSGGAAAPTLSGCGVTWVQVATILMDTARRLTLFRGMVASPSSGAVTIDFGANTQLRCGWSIVEFAGIDTGGANGADSVVQSNTDSASSTTSLTVTLGAFGGAGNATYGYFAGTDNDPTYSMGTGFTILHTQNSPGENSSIMTEWRDDNDTSVDASSTATMNWGGIAAEIKEAPVGGNTRRYSLTVLGVG